MFQVMDRTDMQTNEIVTALVQRELISAAKLIGTVRDVSSFATKGASSISFPRAGSFSVTKKLPGQPVQSQKVVYNKDELLLNQHAVINFIIEKVGSYQAPYEVEVDTIARAARAHARQVDLDIFEKLKLVSVANPNHVIPYTGGTMGNETLAKNDILAARALLQKQGIDMQSEFGSVFLGVNPDQEAQLLRIDDFVSAEKYGSAVIPTGALGTLYGMIVVATPYVEVDQSVVYHREACGFGLQLTPDIVSSFNHEYVGMEYTVDQLYGVKEMNEGKLAVLIEKP